MGQRRHHGCHHRRPHGTNHLRGCHFQQFWLFPGSFGIGGRRSGARGNDQWKHQFVRRPGHHAHGYRRRQLCLEQCGQHGHRECQPGEYHELHRHRDQRIFLYRHLGNYRNRQSTGYAQLDGNELQPRRYGYGRSEFAKPVRLRQHCHHRYDVGAFEYCRPDGIYLRSNAGRCVC